MKGTLLALLAIGGIVLWSRINRAANPIPSTGDQSGGNSSLDNSDNGFQGIFSGIGSLLSSGNTSSVTAGQFGLNADDSDTVYSNTLSTYSDTVPSSNPAQTNLSNIDSDVEAGIIGGLIV